MRRAVARTWLGLLGGAAGFVIAAGGHRIWQHTTSEGRVEAARMVGLILAFALGLFVACLVLVGLIVLTVWAFKVAFAEETPPPADYLSYDEAKESPGCQCRPTNVFYWELSAADTAGCPVHSASLPTIDTPVVDSGENP